MIKDIEKRIELFKFNPLIIKTRWLWSEVVIEQRLCDECKAGSEINIHYRDINNLIKELEKAKRHLDKKIKKIRKRLKILEGESK